MGLIATILGRRSVFRAARIKTGGARLGIAAILLMVVACTSPHPAAAPISEEEAQDFKQTMATDSQTAGEYLRKTQNGKNITEFSLGWFVYNVLTELSSMDDGLDKQFNHDVQSYLKTTFHDNPDSEIAKIDAMAKEGHTPIRLAARSALECLTHIPDSNEPPETQAEDRRQLAAALASLKEHLEQSAREGVGSPSVSAAPNPDTAS